MMADNKRPLKRWPWLTIQIILGNIAVVAVLSGLWFWAFRQQSEMYSHRLMKTFKIEPGSLHSMYVDDVERQLWTGVALGLVVAILASIVLAFLIVRPLRNLANATERLRQGDLGVRAHVPRGEVGHLADNFNALAATLEQEEDRRVRYMADLSHELRTPITSLRGYTEGLEDGIFPADKRYFDLMQGELTQLTALTRTIDEMQLVAPYQESAELPPTVLEVIMAAQARWQQRFHDAGLVLEAKRSTSLDDQRIRLSAQAQQQVIDNLLSNMCRYADVGEPCVFEIVDTGPGTVTVQTSNKASDLDPGSIPTLFDRFTRASRSRTRQNGERASGLGLALVKQIAVVNGGSAEARLERGLLTITLALPLLEAS